MVTGETCCRWRRNTIIDRWRRLCRALSVVTASTTLGARETTGTPGSWMKTSRWPTPRAQRDSHPHGLARAERLIEYANRTYQLFVFLGHKVHEISISVRGSVRDNTWCYPSACIEHASQSCIGCSVPTMQRVPTPSWMSFTDYNSELVPNSC